MRMHNPTLFIECLATEIVETYKYKHLAGICEEQQKQCVQKWRQNSDFSLFLKMNISKLCHRIFIIFFSRITCNSAAYDWAYICVTYIFLTISSIL